MLSATESPKNPSDGTGTTGSSATAGIVAGTPGSSAGARLASSSMPAAAASASKPPSAGSAVGARSGTATIRSTTTGDRRAGVTTPTRHDRRRSGASNQVWLSIASTTVNATDNRNRGRWSSWVRRCEANTKIGQWNR